MNVTLLKNSEKNGRPAELMVIDFLKFEGNNVNDSDLFYLVVNVR